MGLFDSVGVLVGSIVVPVVMLVFAILSFFITVFVVYVGAGLAGYTPSGDFVVLSTAIVASASPVSGLSGLGGS